MTERGLHAQRTYGIRAGLLGFAAACVAASLATGNALAAGTLTAARADRTVSATMSKVGRGAAKHEKLTRAHVATKAVCKPSASGLFRCSYTITISASSVRVLCSGSAYAWGTTPTRVDPKPPKCHKVTPASASGSLSVGTAGNAIRTWAKHQIASVTPAGTVINIVATIDCARQSSKAVACTWESDLSSYNSDSAIQCIEPRAIAFIKPGSRTIYVTGSFDASDCNDPNNESGGGFNVG